MASSTDTTRAATTGDTADADAIRRHLGLGRSRLGRRLLSFLLLGGLAVGAWFLYQHLNQPPPARAWLEEPVSRGNISTIVSATGTVEPVRIAEVGPEISGRIIEVAVSENDRVVTGQVLARFDPEPIEARLEQARAQLDVASARLVELRATVREANLNYKRANELRKSGVNAAREADAATAALQRARAGLAQAEAQERSARAQVTQVEADLARAVLYSPIDGVVLTRTVEPGKAVAASLQTPVLFTIAEDLTRMELRLAIDEADVAKVKPGMEGTFTVDAYGERAFPARVDKIHLAPTLTQNLVTYEASLTVDNGELLIFPGMTATANITASTVKDALRVPNSALRFTPPRDPAATSVGPGMFPGMRPPRTGGRRPNGGEEGKSQAAQGTVYVLEAGTPTRRRVRLGATDGRFTEILGGELKEGDKVVVGVDTGGGDAKAPPSARSAPGGTSPRPPSGSAGGGAGAGR